MEKPGNHDQFFKEIFSQKAHIADLLQYMLPPDLRDNLDLQSLRLENTLYTDNDLRYHFSDKEVNWP